MTLSTTSATGSVVAISHDALARSIGSIVLRSAITAASSAGIVPNGFPLREASRRSMSSGGALGALVVAGGILGA